MTIIKEIITIIIISNNNFENDWEVCDEYFNYLELHCSIKCMSENNFQIFLELKKLQDALGKATESRLTNGDDHRSYISEIDLDGSISGGGSRRKTDAPPRAVPPSSWECEWWGD